ncbi:Hypothetical predicted protein [Olea europaea subsp. europaea]|uniref:Uncharacterized protein n=1 Tax=Olea europaea subsp. europaea TaxID=158383 RepID=A0A8S0TE16_OLEEU|nr:Hypothetical predicted protein [Olea europaea subsp. europaea]
MVTILNHSIAKILAIHMATRSGSSNIPDVSVLTATIETRVQQLTLEMMVTTLGKPSDITESTIINAHDVQATRDVTSSSNQFLLCLIPKDCFFQWSSLPRATLKPTIFKIGIFKITFRSRELPRTTRRRERTSLNLKANHLQNWNLQNHFQLELLRKTLRRERTSLNVMNINAELCW